MMNWEDLVRAGCDEYPKPDVDLEYGTAGFRANASILEHVAFRVGIIACLRSKYTKKTIGLMVTASHNPEADNGVKVVDPQGNMLTSSWEPMATALVNASPSVAISTLLSILRENNIEADEPANVVLGWDSRSSSEWLVSIATEGIQSFGGNAILFSMCTTPLLHYAVKCRNDPTYGSPCTEGYYNKLTKAFNYLWSDVDEVPNSENNYSNYINFDGANGVGTLAMLCASILLKEKFYVEIFNDDLEEKTKLNNQCGADFVRMQQKLPINFETEPDKRCVTFDGDADRILYFYLDQNKQIHVLDGDRMAILIALYLNELLINSGVTGELGIVQTAYANGNSTKYIKETLKVEALCVKTGVKHLHEKALEYDVGIYFEANGHGTVVFSNKLKDQIKLTKGATNQQQKYLTRLSNFIDLVNETVGDALSDFLVIEIILHSKGWSLADWEKLYDNLPHTQAKVTVKDRKLITTTDAERKCVTPPKLQDEIDNLLKSYKSSRAFVRPSGTEDIVRVYAEASTQEEANELAVKVSQLVFDMAFGVGERPE